MTPARILPDGRRVLPICVPTLRDAAIAVCGSALAALVAVGLFAVCVRWVWPALERMI